MICKKIILHLNDKKVNKPQNGGNGVMTKRKKVKIAGKASLPTKKGTRAGVKNKPKKVKPARKKAKSSLKKNKPAPAVKRSVRAKKKKVKKALKAALAVKKKTAVKKKKKLKKTKPPAKGAERRLKKAKRAPTGKSPAQAKKKKRKKSLKTAPASKKKVQTKKKKKPEKEKASLKRGKHVPKKPTPSRAKKLKPRPERVKPSAPKEPLGKALQEDISTVLVTGTSSCVGTFLVQHLLRNGYSVVATDRRIKEINVGTGEKSLVVKAGSLADSRFTASCLEGVDAIVHTAGMTEMRPNHKEASLFTGADTRTLFMEARKKGVKRFIHIGSAAVYKRISGHIAEDGAFESRNEFGENQIEAERIVFTDAAPGLPVVTVIRSASIYGPGLRTQMSWVATLPSLVKTLGPYYLRLSGGPRMNLVHGEDVARAAIFLLPHPKACGEVFNIGDNDVLPFSEFINRAMEIYGLKPLGPGVPYPPSTLLQSILPYVAKEDIFSPLTDLSSLLWDRMARKHKLKKELSPRINQESLSFGAKDRILDNRKLLDLGFRLKYPRFTKGWEKTMEWHKTNRWIPSPEEL